MTDLLFPLRQIYTKVHLWGKVNFALAVGLPYTAKVNCSFRCRGPLKAVLLKLRPHICSCALGCDFNYLKKTNACLCAFDAALFKFMGPKPHLHAVKEVKALL